MMFYLLFWFLDFLRIDQLETAIYNSPANFYNGGSFLMIRPYEIPNLVELDLIVFSVRWSLCKMHSSPLLY